MSLLCYCITDLLKHLFSADVVVKLVRRWNYEGIASEGADTLSTSFVEDVLAEYDDEFAAYRETKAAENGGKQVRFL